MNIGYGVQVQPYAVEAGWLRLATIHIGRGALVGTNSVVKGGATIGDGAMIGDQSLVDAERVIADNEYWSGSPSKCRAAAPDVLSIMKSRADDRPWPVGVLLGFVAGIGLLMILPVLMALPSIALVGLISIYVGVGWGLASTILAGPLFVCMVCFLVLICKRLILPKARPGIYPLRSGFGLCKWLNDQVLSLSLALTNTLYATLYLVPFLRALGARIGSWSEVSTVGHIDPDMMILGDGSFVADIAVVGPAIFHRGCVALAPVEVGNRSFVGNGALVPCNFKMGENSLLGVHSVAEKNIESGTCWLCWRAGRKMAGESGEPGIR